MSLVSAEGQLDAAQVFDTLEATWPPSGWHTAPGWRIGAGAGGGKRVSAARATAQAPSIKAMEETQAGLGQPPLVMVTGDESALDRALADAGYGVVDPTVALAAPVASVASAAGDLPRVSAYEVTWPPLAFQEEIWATGGVGPARLAVMDRVTRPRVAMLGRRGDRPAATAFVACHGGVAMVHALEVLPQMRRQGLARNLMLAAARWGAAQGATHLAVLVTRANAPALALYTGLGLREVTGYHYRARPTGSG